MTQGADNARYVNPAEDRAVSIFDQDDLSPTARARAALAELREALDVIRPLTPRHPDGAGPSLEQMARPSLELVGHVLDGIDALLGPERWARTTEASADIRKIRPL